MGQPEKVLDIRYFYWRDDQRRPLITLCRVVTIEGMTGYGWAITGPHDTPHKDDVWFTDPDTKKDWCEPGGRTIARARALRALKQGKYRSIAPHIRIYARPVQRLEARHVMADCKAHSFRELVDLSNIGALPPSMQPPCLKGVLHVAT